MLSRRRTKRQAMESFEPGEPVPSKSLWIKPVDGNSDEAGLEAIDSDVFIPRLPSFVEDFVC